MVTLTFPSICSIIICIDSMVIKMIMITIIIFITIIPGSFSRSLSLPQSKRGRQSSRWFFLSFLLLEMWYKNKLPINWFIVHWFIPLFKESDFQELQPSCLSLMTDVFGNYVIQVKPFFLSLLPLPNSSTITMTMLPYKSSKAILRNAQLGLSFSCCKHWNLVFQKFFQHGSDEQRGELLKKVTNIS